MKKQLRSVSVTELDQSNRSKASCSGSETNRTVNCCISCSQPFKTAESNKPTEIRQQKAQSIRSGLLMDRNCDDYIPELDNYDGDDTIPYDSSDDEEGYDTELDTWRSPTGSFLPYQFEPLRDGNRGGQGNERQDGTINRQPGYGQPIADELISEPDDDSDNSLLDDSTDERYNTEDSSTSVYTSEASTALESDSQQSRISTNRSTSNEPVTEVPTTEPQPSTSGARNLAPQETATVAPIGDDDIKTNSSVKISKQTEISPSQKSKKLASTQGSEDDEQSCPICFELWDNSGLHRLVSLKCGHLFGQSCIERWLKGNGQRCPQCNLKARKADIRIVYAKTLKVRDTSERDRTQKELEQERATRLKLEVDLLQTKAKYTKAQTELEILREQIKKQAQNSTKTAIPNKIATTSQHGQTLDLKKLYYVKTLDICKEGNCRVTAYLEFMTMLVASQSNLNPLFSGYGIKKISAVNFCQYEYIGIHDKQIRDVCFGNDLKGLMLTASMDKTAKLTCVVNNTVVHTYQCDVPVWSCTWNKRNNFQFYAGLQNGAVLLYDTRQNGRHLLKLPETGSCSPVVSLQHADVAPSSSFACAGLLVGQLDRCSFFESSYSEENKLHVLPIEGPITSLSFEPSTRHFMVSNRPNQRHSSTRHLVFELSQIPTGADIKSNLIETFYGGNTQRLMGKSRLVCNPNNETSMLACGVDESSNSVIIWDVGTGQNLQKLQAASPILDICSFKCTDKNYICTLTEKSLNAYRW